MDQPTTQPPLDKPAEHLVGVVLSGGWRVVSRTIPRPGSTGGAFSVGYLAERADPSRPREVQVAFVKALDFTGWRQLDPDLLTAIQQMTASFAFERAVVLECAGRRMTNVVRGIDSGQIDVGSGPFATVSYLIFEVAEGDIRAFLDAAENLTVVWSLRVLHNVANGLRQLHGAGIAHQDVKPSNVLTFPDSAKLGDVGRSFWPGHQSPHEANPLPGDLHYAPPECLYGYVETDRTLRSRAIDAYHLGSMIIFMFTKASATGALWASLRPEFYFGRWTGTFDDVVPYLREAFNAYMDEVTSRLPTPVQVQLSELVRELCDPDPRQRGNKRFGARDPQRYSMERYVSRLDLLVKSASVRLPG